MRSRLEEAARWAPVAGAVWYVVFFVIGYFMILPEWLQDPGETVEMFVDDTTLVTMGGWIGALSVIGLLWFFSSLTTSMAADGEHRLGRIVTSAGAATAAATAAGFFLFSLGALRADEEGGLGTDYALALHDIGIMLLFAIAPVLAATALFAAVLAGARIGAPDPWLLIVTLLLAIALAIPMLAFYAFWVFLAWVLYVGHRLRVALSQVAPSGGSPGG